MTVLCTQARVDILAVVTLQAANGSSDVTRNTLALLQPGRDTGKKKGKVVPVLN
jgi:hypothetical protein